MIQRVQSLYLLAVFILSVVCLFGSMGRFIGAEGEIAAVLNNLTLVTEGEASYRPWAMFGLLLLVAVLALVTILLFRKRMIQIRLTVFSSVLLIGYYAVYAWFIYTLGKELDASFKPSLTACFPLLGLILNYLAIRAIGADEFLVRSLDRLR